MSGKKYYCGAWWFPEWLSRIASTKFNASCKIHDLDYGAPGEFSKDEADQRFLEHMRRQAKDSLVWRNVAYIYYWLARWFGGPSWEKENA